MSLQSRPTCKKTKAKLNLKSGDPITSLEKSWEHFESSNETKEIYNEVWQLRYLGYLDRCPRKLGKNPVKKRKANDSMLT